MYKICIINLEKNINRRVVVENQLINYNITNYEFIKAIDGDKINTKLIELPNNFKNRINIDLKYKDHFSNREIACLDSHILAINKAIKDDLDYVIILEDDIILCEDWNIRLEKLISITPKKWNHIFLSGQLPEEKKFRSLNFAPFLHVEQSIPSTMGAFSYILKKEIFHIVKEQYESHIMPTDNIIEKLINDNIIKSFTFYPFLSYHDNDKISDIWGETYLRDHESKRYFMNKML